MDSKFSEKFQTNGRMDFRFTISLIHEREREKGGEKEKKKRQNIRASLPETRNEYLNVETSNTLRYRG